MKARHIISFSVLLSISVLPAIYAEESFNITTFYPVPSGIYRSLKSETLVVGDKDSTDFPSEEGVIRFQPRAEPSIAKKGDLYFDKGGTKFKYYDGSRWKALSVDTGSTCSWFRGSCPVGWAVPGPGEEYHKTGVKNDDLPITGPRYRYVWLDSSHYAGRYSACEPRNIDLDNPPAGFVHRPINYSKNLDPDDGCNICFGNGCTDYEEVYSNSGERVIIDSFYRFYLYRCIYPGDPGELHVATTYDMYYCCPSE